MHPVVLLASYQDLVAAFLPFLVVLAFLPFGLVAFPFVPADPSSLVVAEMPPVVVQRDLQSDFQTHLLVVVLVACLLVVRTGWGTLLPYHREQAFLQVQEVVVLLLLVQVVVVEVVLLVGRKPLPCLLAAVVPFRLAAVARMLLLAAVVPFLLLPLLLLAVVVPSLPFLRSFPHLPYLHWPVAVVVLQKLLLMALRRHHLPAYRAFQAYRALLAHRAEVALLQMGWLQVQVHHQMGCLLLGLHRKGWQHQAAEGDIRGRRTSSELLNQGDGKMR